MGIVQDLISKGYGGYAGWGEAEAQADYNATGGQGKYTAGNSGGASSSSSPSVASYDPIAEAQKLNQWYREQNQPYIQSLQQGIPEVQKFFEASKSYLTGQVEPLKQRYDNLLNEMKKNVSVATSREFGKRGISTESGLYDQTLAGTINPMMERIGLSREQDIQSILNQVQGLTSAETSQMREIQNAIAQAQAGNPTAAMTGAQNLLQMNQDQSQFNAGQELQKLLASQQTSDPYMALGEGQTLFNLMTGQPMYTAPKTYKDVQSASGGNDPLGLGL